MSIDTTANLVHDLERTLEAAATGHRDPAETKPKVKAKPAKKAKRKRG